MATVGSEEFEEAELELTDEKEEKPEPDVKLISEKDVKWLTVRAPHNHGHHQGLGKRKLPRCFREDGYFKLDIDVHTGFIKDWPTGDTADIFFKVIDEGSYALSDEKGNIIVSKEDCYVPYCIGVYGDYIKMKINELGQIEDWNFNLTDCLETLGVFDIDDDYDNS